MPSRAHTRGALRFCRPPLCPCHLGEFAGAICSVTLPSSALCPVYQRWEGRPVGRPGLKHHCPGEALTPGELRQCTTPASFWVLLTSTWGAEPGENRISPSQPTEARPDKRASGNARARTGGGSSEERPPAPVSQEPAPRWRGWERKGLLDLSTLGGSALFEVVADTDKAGGSRWGAREDRGKAQKLKTVRLKPGGV